MKQKIVALVPAAGTGTRLGDALPKQYLAINHRPLIYHALAALSAREVIGRVVLNPLTEAQMAQQPGIFV